MASIRSGRQLACLMKLASSRPALKAASVATIARHSARPRSIQPVGRSFATAKPGVKKVRNPNTSEVFSLDKIPLESFMAIVVRNDGAFTRLTPEGYYECARQFAEAVKLGANPLAVPLSGEQQFRPEILHDIGCMMRQIPTLSGDAFTVGLWSSASAAGYRLSTLSLIRHIIRSKAYGRGTFSHVEKHFKSLVATAKDPDALTAEGELLYSQEKHEAALRVLQMAMQIGKDDESFEWREYCELCLGRIYVKLKRYQEAKDIFKRLAESGVPEADIELGQMLRPTDRDTAEKHLFAVACSGRPDIFAQLSDMSLERALQAKDEEELKDHQRWSDEWARLANTSAAF